MYAVKRVYSEGAVEQVSWGANAWLEREMGCIYIRGVVGGGEGSRIHFVCVF